MRFALLLFACAMLLLAYGCAGQTPAQQGAQAGAASGAQSSALPEKPASNASQPSKDVPEAAAGNPPALDVPTPAVPGAAGKTTEYGTYLLHVPSKPNALNDSIVIVAFSPSGDARAMVGAWQAASEKRGWPVFASKTFHNGDDLPMSFNSDTFADIANAAASLGYARPKLVFTGFSGGGQVSHAFAFGSPGKVAAVVTNCGIINRGFLNYTSYYPHNKTVLFIASPTDFRYDDMKDDKAYLEKLGWKTGWLEFSGGHALAPPETYEQAAGWLENAIGNSMAGRPQNASGAQNAGAANLTASIAGLKFGNYTLVVEDLSLAGGAGRVSCAIIGIYGNGGSRLAELQGCPGQDSYWVAPDRHMWRIVVYQTAPGYTHNSAWAEVAVFG
ncbi:MAG: hypothetical protein WC861_05445 [Candidatus Micrarchaeia archaeon]|jgi:predicted esterase